MTNSELVTEIQAGKTELLAELWQQNERFVRMMSTRYFEAYYKSANYCDVDDLVQTGYIAMQEAAFSFNVELGYSFLTWLTPRLLKYFHIAAGLRSDKDKKQREFENSCLRLDAPIQSEDSDTVDLLETISDNSEPFTDAVDREIFNRQLHEQLSVCLSLIPDDAAELIRLEYLEANPQRRESDKSKRELHRAMKKLRYCVRTSQEGKKLRSYIHPDGDYDYKASGLTSYNRTGVSETERAALRLLALQKNTPRL